MFSDKLVTTDARQIAITQVDKGSPADGVLAPGDVILGVAGQPFSHDPRTEFGVALTVAESDAGKGELRLIRWRATRQHEVILKLPVLGTYSGTAPYDCPKSAHILEQGSKALASRIQDPSYRPNPITRSLNGLGLLAIGDPNHLPVLKTEAEWAAGFSTASRQPWHYGYVIMFLSEYLMATGDNSVLPGLRRLALEAAKGQSIVGSWGHGFAEEDGRLGGYGMMNSPGIPLTTSLVMARMAGVSDPALDLAINRSTNLLRFYTGKGSIPYGDHIPWTQTHEDNGKNGMAAVLFQTLGEAKPVEFFSRMSLASHGPERDTGHTGNFFNMTWAMPGISLSGPQATGAWMKEFGAWYFDLARRWDGTFVHQGPPDKKNDKYAGWDTTGAYLLAYALPKKKLLLTGRKPSAAPGLDAAAAAAIIDDGRGWSNKDRDTAYDALTVEKLLERLTSWSPIVRERAAMAIARRKALPLAELESMLEAPALEARYGACQAIAQLKGAAAPAVPSLQKALTHPDLWLRIEASEALAAIGPAAMPVLPQLLEKLAQPPSPDDPRAMEQRYLCFAIFGQMLRNSLEGVDQDLLRKAVTAGLKNDDGRARGAVGGVYRQLSYEHLKPLLPVIREAIVTPSPSGIMFASQVRLLGVEILAKHRIREGMTLCLDIMEIDKWGKQDRISRCLKTLATYGSAAKPLLPRLAQLEKDLLAHREAKSLAKEIGQVRDCIRSINEATAPVELRSLADP
jgi:hypothetical protein